MNTNKKTARRDLIVQAAATVFAEKGFSSTLMADIARSADIGKGTIYEYFRSKDDLFLAVFDYFVQKINQAGVNVTTLGLGSAADRLNALSRSIAAWIIEHHDIYTLSLEFWAASVTGSEEMRARLKGAFRDNYRKFRDLCAAIIEDGIRRGEFRNDIEPAAVASAIVGSWDGLGLQSWFEDDFDIEKTISHYTDMLLRGLFAPPI
ncbi:MAG: TetR/AcrR family transcriptional regulator [Thermodesulfobacteriota bacterium]|nr:TetR/AcrR family transcriptional regulator [Thermodesulfobacteriota bacterium]